MEIFVVGGAVRDGLMGLTPKDVDYVVVGATPDQMLALGYEQVGADFPVFLHPETQDEYALARTERKTGDGYHGFDVDADPTTTLADDLSRRDLTINAMALNMETGVVHDPFNGRGDIQDKILRHVSPAFAEDPLRVVRLARFYARYSDFTIASETSKLAEDVVVKGDLEHLPPERFWAELQKVMTEEKPERFFYAMSSFAMDTHVQFFYNLYGAMSVSRFAELKRITRSVFTHASAPDFRLMFHTALFAKRHAESIKTAPVATQKLYANVDKVREVYEDTVDVVYDIIQGARGFGNDGTDMFYLLMAMKMAEETGEFFVVNLATLKESLATASVIKAEMFPQFQGKELGEAIKQGRKDAISQVLSKK